MRQTLKENAKFLQSLCERKQLTPFIDRTPSHGYAKASSALPPREPCRRQKNGRKGERAREIKAKRDNGMERERGKSMLIEGRRKRAEYAME